MNDIFKNRTNIILLAIFLLAVYLFSFENTDSFRMYKPLSEIEDSNNIVKSLEINDDHGPYFVHFFSPSCGGCVVEHEYMMMLKNESKLSMPIYGVTAFVEKDETHNLLSKDGDPYNDVIYLKNFPNMFRVPQTWLYFNGQVWNLNFHINNHSKYKNFVHAVMEKTRGING